MNTKIIAKYKLNHIHLLTGTECEDASLILRYLLERCTDLNEFQTIEAYIGKIETRLLDLANPKTSEAI